MKLNRKKIRKMILDEMFGARPRGPQEHELAAQAIQRCVQATLDSGPTADNPLRPVMREKLNAFQAGMGEEQRVNFALNIRTQKPSIAASQEFGIPHLQDYIRRKAFNLIAQMYGLSGLSKRY